MYLIRELLFAEAQPPQIVCIDVSEKLDPFALGLV